jgi:hypothetical protein
MKPTNPGTHYGEISPDGQWFWNGTGKPDDAWIAIQSSSDKQEKKMAEQTKEAPPVTEEAKKAAPVTEEKPEQQLVADQTAALTQLHSCSEPLRHSVSPAVSDFTGISDNTALLASLTNWHAQGQVFGLIRNDAGPPTVPYAWKLTHMGSSLYAKNQTINKTAPAITSLSPSSTSIAAGGGVGKQVTITINGTSLRGTQVAQVGGTAVPSTYVSKVRIDMKYTLPASPATVQVTIYDGETGQTTANSPLTVTA